MKITASYQGFLIEAFVVNFTRENDLNGFVGSFPKSRLRKDVKKVIRLIEANVTNK